MEQKADLNAIPPCTISREDAYELGGRIQRLAASQAAIEHDLIARLGDLDASGGMGWYDGIKTPAHWLSWACSMSPGTAREHVRVARALRRMPRTDALFAQAKLTYSKVRELTRLVGQVDERELCDLAELMTASQLARTVRAFRTCTGSRLTAEQRAKFSWHETGDGVVRLSITMPTEQAALIRAAIDSAVSGQTERTADGALPINPARPQLDGLIELAQTYLDGTYRNAREDDHHLVVVQVAAESLAPAVTPPDTPPESVPAGTSRLTDGRCVIEGTGPIEPQTALRLACTGKVVGTITDANGDVLALGRSRRLASRAQRRALRFRDHNQCQYPGCQQTRWLQAHHLVSWLAGGPTDLDNLILLCQRHHTCVHEGGLSIARQPSPHLRWRFTRPDGRSIETPAPELDTDGEEVSVPSASVFPLYAGAGFDLSECVRVLFGVRLDEFAESAA